MAARRRIPTALAAAVLAMAGAAAHAAAGDPLVQEEAGVVVDWRRGRMSASAGAAPDHRMPSAEVARAGADRRARAAARVRLGEALHKLPLGGGRKLDDAAVGRALERARATDVDYQSNGGVVVTLEVSFGDWDDAPGPSGARAADGGVPAAASSALPSTPDAPPPVVVSVGEGRLGAAPVIVAGGREIQPAGVRYDTGAPALGGPRPLKAKVDKQGRVIIDGAGPGEFAGRPLLIYLHRVLR